MIRIFKLLLLAVSSLGIWARPLSAEINVRSGEHSNFTRLVIYSPPERSPVLSRTNIGYRFATGDPSDQFDLSKIFEKIPKTRVKGISMPANGIIDIVVDCECHSRTEQLTDGRFVIDIVTGNSKAETSAPSRTAPSSLPAYHTNSIQSARRGLPIFTTAQDTHQTAAALPKTDNAAPRPTTDSAAKEQLDQKELLNQLSRAAAQGLFTFEIIPETVTKIPSDTAVAYSSDPTSASVPKSQITIHTSVDRDAGSQPLPSNLSDIAHVCSPNKAFSIGSWGGDPKSRLEFPNYPAPIEGSRMNAASNNFGDLKRYLQQQLHLTLGAEALVFLNDPETNFDGQNDLILIAEIMENGEATDHKRMIDFLSCDGEKALWAALSQPRLPRGADINTNAILSEFSGLPKHLRTHLGPMLMRKFLSIGDTASATTTNQIIARGGAPADTSNTLATAKLSLAKTDFNSAEQKLTKVAMAEDQNSVEAALTLIESRIVRNEGISTQELDRLDSLATQHNTTSAGRRMENAAIRALIHMAQFSEATKRLHLAKGFPALQNTDHQTIINEFGVSLTQKASDGIFLRYVFGQDFWAFATEETRLALADRLLELGFAQQAQNMLESDSLLPGRAVRTLLAKAALKQYNPKQALSHISGLESSEAQRIRASALALRNATGSDSNEQATPVANITANSAQPLNLEGLRELLAQAQQSRITLEQNLRDIPEP